MKENRTFDQVFGQRRGVRGDPTLAELGMGVRVAGEDGAPGLARADVSPNHQALADRFAISDNFYCDSDQSNTGHRWVVGVYPNEWVEVNARSRIESRVFSRAPGRRNVAGSSATVLPEDYNEAGALWEHLDRHGVPFFNFGFGAEMPASIEDALQRQTGIRMAVGYPLPKPLFDHSSRTYPTFNMAIPDQYRMDMFEQTLRERWLSGRERVPAPRHARAAQRPPDQAAPGGGLPVPRVGTWPTTTWRLGGSIDDLSHTPWWKDMLVIVTEDDPQGGQDHVEAHRSVLMLIGPYVKRGYVSHTLASFGSLMRLIFTLARSAAAQPVRRDRRPAARRLHVDAGHWTPYRARMADPRLFDPNAAFKPFDRRFDWRSLAESPIMDDPEEMRRDYKEKK